MANIMHKVIRGMQKKTQDSFLNPEKQAKYFEEHRASLGIDSVGLPTDSYKNLLVDGSIRHFIDLANIKTPQGISLTKPLMGIPQAQIDKINTLLQPTQATTDAIASYAALLKGINSSTHQFETEAIVSHLQEIKGKAVESIKLQHSAEKTKLINLLDTDDAFKNDLANHNIPVAIVKDAMLEALEKSHAEAIKKFEDALDKPIKNLHLETQNEHARIAFLAALYEDKEMKKIIDEAIGNKHPQATILANSQVPNELFKGVKVENLAKINSMSGRNSILYNKESKTFGLQLPLFDIDNQVQKDLQTLALTIKAAGHKNITMNLNHPNKERAEELGRKSYAACIAAGFDPKNIHIVVNGKKLTDTYKKGEKVQGELLAQHPGIQQKTNEHALQLAEANQKAFSGKYKEDLEQLKATLPAPPAEPPAEANPSTAPAV